MTIVICPLCVNQVGQLSVTGLIRGILDTGYHLYHRKCVNRLTNHYDMT